MHLKCPNIIDNNRCNSTRIALKCIRPGTIVSWYKATCKVCNHSWELRLSDPM